MNNYVFRNLTLFVSVVVLSIFLIGVVQYFSIDREAIVREKEELDVINQKFEKNVELIIRDKFGLIDFLTNTPFPSIAITFDMDQQFNATVDQLDNGLEKIGIFLFDLDSRLVAHRHINMELANTIKVNGIEGYSKNVFRYDSDFIMYTRPIYTAGSGKIGGYLFGVRSAKSISDAIEAAYREVTVNYARFKPDIEIIFNKTNEISFSENHHNEDPAAFVSTNFKYSSPTASVFSSLRKGFIQIFSIGGVILALFTYFLWRSLKKPVQELLQVVHYVSGEKEESYTGPLPKDSVFKKIADALLQMQKHRTLLEREKRKKEISEHLANTASQVAHDIRSPLTALNVVTQQLTNLPEDQRLLIRSAVQRIDDIANDLAGKRHEIEGKADEQEKFKVQLLSSLVEPLVSEKRVQIRSKHGIQIESDLGVDSYGLFGRVQPIQFKRVLSNLINNSVEALGEKGFVKVSLSSDDSDVQIRISDNGKGIPQDVLPKLMQKGATFDKEKGSGLGLYHAKQTVESWGGQIDIDSKIGSGTHVTLFLPKTSPPDWFVPAIEIADDMHVVILDDDNSIHQVWQSRLDALNLKRDLVFHFTSPHTIISWYKENKNEKHSYLFLCDYELLGHQENGLDVIRELDIGDSAILVTSRFEEEDVKEGCKKLGVKLLPKNLAGFVPIKFVKKEIEDQPEYILIDDNEINCSNWRIAAKSCQKKVRTFSSAQQFYAKMSQLDKATKIYIDSNLADNLKGEDVAKDLFSKGFKRIYLCTGYPKDHFPEMPWIKEIVGKNPPFFRSKFSI